MKKIQDLFVGGEEEIDMSPKNKQEIEVESSELHENITDISLEKRKNIVIDCKKNCIVEKRKGSSFDALEKKK